MTELSKLMIINFLMNNMSAYCIELFTSDGKLFNIQKKKNVHPNDIRRITTIDEYQENDVIIFDEDTAEILNLYDIDNDSIIAIVIDHVYIYGKRDDIPEKEF